MDKKFYSPINGEELVSGNDGLLYSPTSDLLFKLNKSGKVVTLKSPINGGELHLGVDGFFYDQYNSIQYMFINEKVIPLISPIHGGVLIRDNDLLFTDVENNTKYMISADGVIEPLIDPSYGGNLSLSEDGTYKSDRTKKDVFQEEQKRLEETDRLVTIDDLVGLNINNLPEIEAVDIPDVPNQDIEQDGAEGVTRVRPEGIIDLSDAEIDELVSELQTEENSVVQETPKENKKINYNEYRSQMEKNLHATREGNSHFHVVFVVHEDKCHYHLKKILGDESDIVVKETFPYDEEFRRNFLELTLIDFVKKSPLLNSRILLPEIKAKEGTFQSFFENNSGISIENIHYNYAKAISDHVKALDYNLYRREMPSLAGLSIMKVRNGFVKILPMLGFIAVIYGIGIILAVLFIK